MLDRNKRLFLIVLCLVILISLILQKTLFKEKVTSNKTTGNKTQLHKYETQKSISVEKEILVTLAEENTKPKIKKGEIDKKNEKTFSATRLDFLDADSALYKQYHEIYSKTPFKFKFIGDHLVSVFKKYEEVDFFTTHMKPNNTGISLEHQQLMDELADNDLYGIWDNSLSDNFRAAMQDYNVENIFSITSVNCKQRRCVATISFDNNNIDIIEQFFSKLNLDANYHFYALTSYHMSAFEATLLIIRTKHA